MSRAEQIDAAAAAQAGDMAGEAATYWARKAGLLTAAVRQLCAEIAALTPAAPVADDDCALHELEHDGATVTCEYACTWLGGGCEVALVAAWINGHRMPAEDFSDRRVRGWERRIAAALERERNAVLADEREAA